MIYTLLQKRKRKVNIHQTDDYKFYAKNAPIYAQILAFYHFGLSENQPFRIIQANIIIKAMMNKELIESKLESFSLESTQNTQIKQDEYIKNKVWKLLDDNSAPYFPQDKSRIYVPIFSRSLNLIYNEECSKLLEYPYNNLMEKPQTSCVDLFDTYGIDLYNSPFTSLILSSGISISLALPAFLADIVNLLLPCASTLKIAFSVSTAVISPLPLSAN